MLLRPVLLLMLGAATVGVIHSLLPDHWVPLAVVARTQKWSLFRLARVSSLAAGGHVLTSIALGGVVGLIGLQFRNQIETQQGHIVGGVLVATGVVFLVWGLTGHGHAHEHGAKQSAGNDGRREARMPADGSESRAVDDLAIVGRQDLDEQAHRHQHAAGIAVAPTHVHEHAHAGVRHSHLHSHEAFVQARADLIVSRSSRGTMVGHLAAIAVPFGVAASPDLTFLPFAIAAAAYGGGAVGAVLGAFGATTMVAFVGLTVVATALGYQMKGEWLEDNANTITSVVLIAIGVIAFIGI